MQRMEECKWQYAFYVWSCLILQIRWYILMGNGSFLINKDHQRDVISIFLFTDSTVVFGVGKSSIQQKGRCMYAAATSGSHVGCCTCCWGDGCNSWPRSWLQHQVWRLYVSQDHSEVSHVGYSTQLYVSICIVCVNCEVLLLAYKPKI